MIKPKLRERFLGLVINSNKLRCTLSVHFEETYFMRFFITAHSVECSGGFEGSDHCGFQFKG